MTMHLYPRCWATRARPMPVLPLVGSTIVPPGFSAPLASAASTMRTAIRSFTEPPGLRYSSLASTSGASGRSSRVTDVSRTSGVLPTRSTTDSAYCTGASSCGPGSSPPLGPIPSDGRPPRARVAPFAAGQGRGMTQTAVPTAQLPGGGSMPLLGFGTWQITGPQAYDAVRTALDVGYRHIDTATVYRNEEEVGRALADSGVPRGEVFVTTKVPPGADDPRKTLETSLQKLGTDHLDLWLIHWTEGDSIHEDLWQVLLEAQQAGKGRDVGVSNYSLDQIDRLTDATGQQPAVNQIEWAPTLYDERIERGHRERGVVLEGYSALKNSDRDDPVLREVAEAHSVTPAQVVLRWHLEHGVVVIPKSATPERIASNVAITGFSLSPEEVARVDGLAGA